MILSVVPTISLHFNDFFGIGMNLSPFPNIDDAAGGMDPPVE
jgi:hypothetical protein